MPMAPPPSRSEPSVIRPVLMKSASIRTRGATRRKKSGDAPAVEGIVVFGAQRAIGPITTDFDLPEAGRCGFAAEMIYRDQWLFHGPALQAVQRIGAASRHGIEGTSESLPDATSCRPPMADAAHGPDRPRRLHALTRLLGPRQASRRGRGRDVPAPARVAHDPRRRSAEGALVDCRIRVLEITRHRVHLDADLVGPDGRLWVALRGWEDWRFFWPGRYRDVFRMPDRVFVGEPLP